jgi:uncharacterized protein YfiM (DUF2279 family)
MRTTRTLSVNHECGYGLGPIVRAFGTVGAVFALAGNLAAMDVAIDQPDNWYDPQASHHAKHLVGGAAFGAVTFTAAELVTDSRPGAYVLAIAGGLCLGAGYELWNGRNGSCYVDPVDVAWTTAGAAIGAVIADYTGQAIGLALTHDSVAVSARVAW